MARMDRLRKNFQLAPAREGHEFYSCHQLRKIDVGFSP